MAAGATVQANPCTSVSSQNASSDRSGPKSAWQLLRSDNLAELGRNPLATVFLQASRGAAELSGFAHAKVGSFAFGYLTEVLEGPILTATPSEEPLGGNRGELQRFAQRRGPTHEAA